MEDFARHISHPHDDDDDGYDDHHHHHDDDDDYEDNDYDSFRHPGHPSFLKTEAEAGANKRARRHSESSPAVISQTTPPSPLVLKREQIMVKRSQSPTPPRQTSAGDAATVMGMASGTVVVASTSHVNGKGMWAAWCRDFNTPLKALLDLFDNAVDASWTFLNHHDNNHHHHTNDNTNTNTNNAKQDGGGGGGVDNNSTGIEQPSLLQSHVNDDDQHKPRIHVDIDRYGGNRGIFLRNACHHTIPSLKDVLEVYKSSKSATAIGENGVGIKQACASLSGLSFVFTKTKDYYSLGLIMEAIQRTDGIVLPSIQFRIEDDLENNLRMLARNQPHSWGLALAEYGAGNDGISGSSGAPDEEALEHGITNCLDHFSEMTRHRMWKDYDNVFTVVLAKLRHATYDRHEVINLLDSDIDDEEETRNNKSAHKQRNRGGGKDDVEEMEKRGEALLDELKETLPYQYLHLHALDVKVKKDTVQGIYWEKRLVELSQFNVDIDRQQPFWNRDGPSWYRDPLETAESPNTIRFYAGFDPYRCREGERHAKRNGDEDAVDDDDDALDNFHDDVDFDMKPASRPRGSRLVNNKRKQAATAAERLALAASAEPVSSAMKIYTYSRESGRLITVEHDPRTELKLTAGSTDFKQGLTIILDDYNGTLPLESKKQYVSYGASEHGRAHEESVRQWKAAIIHFFWNYHFKRFGKLKEALGMAVRASIPDLETAYGGTHPKFTPVPLSRGSYITYTNLKFGIDSWKLRAVTKGKRAQETEMRIGYASDIYNMNQDDLKLVIRLNTTAGASVVQRHENKQGKKLKKRKRSKVAEAALPAAAAVAVDHSGMMISPEDSGPPSRRQRKSGLTQTMEWSGDAAGIYQVMAEKDAIAADLTQERDEFFERSKELSKKLEAVKSDKTVTNQEATKLKKAQKELKREIQSLKDALEMEKKNTETAQRQARQLGEENKKLRRQLQLGNTKTSNAASTDTTDTTVSKEEVPSSNDVANGAVDADEVARWRRRIVKYKNRSSFFEEQAESYRKKVEEVTAEKKRLEEHIASMLAFDCASDD